MVVPNIKSPVQKTDHALFASSKLGVDRLSAGPIIGADIKHFTDYRYRPFSKQICRLFFYFYIMQTNILFTGDIIYW